MTSSWQCVVDPVNEQVWERIFNWCWWRVPDFEESGGCTRSQVDDRIRLPLWPADPVTLGELYDIPSRSPQL